MVSSNKETKSVHIAPSEKDEYHVDTLTFEERSQLWSTPKDRRRYKQDTKESVRIYRYYDGDLSSLDANKYCARGLEAYCEDTMLSKEKCRRYHINCILELQDSFRNLEKGGSGPHPERHEKVMYVIDTLNSRASAIALKRASEDRSAADQIFKEESERCRLSLLNMGAKTKINVNATTCPFTEEPLPRIQSAMTA